jgi:hypothetical protein
MQWPHEGEGTPAVQACQFGHKDPSKEPSGGALDSPLPCNQQTQTKEVQAPNQTSHKMIKVFQHIVFRSKMCLSIQYQRNGNITQRLHPIRLTHYDFLRACSIFDATNAIKAAPTPLPSLAMPMRIRFSPSAPISGISRSASRMYFSKPG